MLMKDINGKEPVKAYNIAILDDDSAEINMYGDVVSTWPVDWWTGEKIAGNFIAVDEFLQDLELIKDKANITININSAGGELYAGIAIYNRLKALKGNVITINDGLAASAASVIFQAGNTRKMNTGSNLMIHGVSGLLFDYYNIQDLKNIIKQFEAHNKAVINIYAEKSGRPADEIKTLMDKETWFTGQSAIDAGLADELIIGEPVQMSLTADKTYIVINGLSVPANRFANIPQGLPVMMGVNQPVKAVNSNKNTNIGGKKEMEIKTVEDLKNAFPEFVKQIENEAKTAGISEGRNSERERLKAIEEIQNKIADTELVRSAKYGDNPIDAKDLAFMALQKEAATGAAILKNISEDSAKSGVDGIHTTPNAGNETTKNDEQTADEIMNKAIETYKAMNGGKK